MTQEIQGGSLSFFLIDQPQRQLEQPTFSLSGNHLVTSKPCVALFMSLLRETRLKSK